MDLVVKALFAAMTGWVRGITRKLTAILQSFIVIVSGRVEWCRDEGCLALRNEKWSRTDNLKILVGRYPSGFP